MMDGAMLINADKKPMSAEEALAALDTDGDGIITAEELVAVNDENFNTDAVIEEFTLRMQALVRSFRQSIDEIIG